MKIINDKGCIHCNKKINDFNKARYIELISDMKTEITKKYCCEICYQKYYKSWRKNGTTKTKF